MKATTGERVNTEQNYFPDSQFLTAASAAANERGHDSAYIANGREMDHIAANSGLGGTPMLGGCTRFARRALTSVQVGERDGRLEQSPPPCAQRRRIGGLARYWIDKLNFFLMPEAHGALRGTGACAPIYGGGRQ